MWTVDHFFLLSRTFFKDFTNFYKSNINFSQCFQDTFILWIPLVFFYAFGPLWLWNLVHCLRNLDERDKSEFKITPCFLFKSIFTVSLIISEILRFGFVLARFDGDEIYGANVMTPLLMINTYVSLLTALKFVYD